MPREKTGVLAKLCSGLSYSAVRREFNMTDSKTYSQ